MRRSRSRRRPSIVFGFLRTSRRSKCFILSTRISHVWVHVDVWMYADRPIRPSMSPSQYTANQGSFRGWTRGNAVPIVEKLLLERMGAALPLFKVFRNALWTAFRNISGQNALYSAYTNSTFSGDDNPDFLGGRERIQCLDPDTNFRLAR